MNESDGMTHGSGDSVTSVGVGTGGMVRLGSGDAVAEGLAVAVGPADRTVVTVVGGALDGAVAAVVAGGVARGRAGREENSTAVTGGAEVVALTGAAPMPPAPPGCPAATGLAAGVASIQPIATAMGRPTVMSPKKSGLGDNRTL